MRTSTLKTCLSILILFASIQLIAQQRTYYNYDYPWTFGLNGGAAWQYSDVDPSLGFGFGLDLAKRIGGRQNSWFALDARGRLMFARQYGQGSERVYNLSDFSALDSNSVSDYTDLGYAFHNHRTSLGALDLEGVITLNRLRERTGWSVQFFGGIGIGLYDVKTDQVAGLGELYAYDLIDTTQSNGRIRRDIRGIRDGLYDGPASGFESSIRGAIMPSLGLAVGYQLTPRFSVGLEHKATWAMADNLDGVLNINSNRPDDVHHYTSLYLRWTLGGSGKDPIIDITAPNRSPYTIRVPTGSVRASIKNVTRRSDVDVYLNGNRIDYFDYNTATEEFFLTVPLVTGQNTIRITARNSYGNDEESTIFIYEPNVNNPNPNNGNGGNNGNNNNPNNGGGNNGGGNTGNPQPNVQAPTVNILNPEDNPFVTDRNTINVDARVTNVTNKSDITFTVNGYTTNDFSYSRSRVKANIDLQDGNNVIEISARNSRGEVRDSRRIVYQKPQVQAPRITFTNPNRNPTNVSDARYTVQATINNVDTDRNITFTVNGGSESFSFRNERLSSTINLREGANVIKVTAYNDGGNADENTTIVYKKQNVPTPPPTPTAKPTVRITSPSGNPHKTTDSQITVYAAIENINNKNDLTFKVNGRSKAFNYDTGRGKFSANIGLVEGNNTVEIEARNSGGTAKDFVNIAYKKDTPTPPTTNAPKITVKTPKTNPYSSPINTTSITAVITGINGKSNVQFIWNGKRYTNFTYNSNTNLFQAKMNLNQGNNTYEIIATNAGGKANVNGKISYKAQPTVNKPVITLVSPSRSPYTSASPTTTVQANITNITSRSDLQVKVGGKTTNSFTFSGGQLKLNVRIANSGTNVEITATNRGGTDKETVVLNYKQTKQPPVITYTNPRKSPHVTSDLLVNLTARVQYVSGRSDIKVTVGGYPRLDFTFSGETLTLSTDIAKSGATIVITATNTDGKDTETMVITRRSQKPEIQLINPRNNNYSPKSSNFEFKATVLHVNNKNDIRLTVNGKNITTFSFSNNTVRYPMTLGNGRTTVLITATNTDGKATQAANLNYSKPKQPPVITYTNPRKSPHVTSNLLINLTARVQYVSSKSDIKVSVGGYPRLDFSFSGETLTLNTDIAKSGATIVITATNSDGQDVETMVIQRIDPVVKPIITLVKPNSGNATTKNATETITINVKHAKSKDEIQLLLNGKRITNYNLNTNTGNLVVKLPLKVGVNRLIITAQNKAGKASKTIIYNRQVAAKGSITPPKSENNSKPIIRFTTPAKTGTTVTTKTYIAKAKVTDVVAKGITVSLNGKKVEGVNYNQKTGQLLIRVNLKSGNNTILVIAKNAKGVSKQTTLIKYRAVPETEKRRGDN